VLFGVTLVAAEDIPGTTHANVALNAPRTNRRLTLVNLSNRT
ncbi:unnamed protein product, partial [Acidocella sp. C78]